MDKAKRDKYVEFLKHNQFPKGLAERTADSLMRMHAAGDLREIAAQLTKGRSKRPLDMGSGDELVGLLLAKALDYHKPVVGIMDPAHVELGLRIGLKHKSFEAKPAQPGEQGFQWNLLSKDKHALEEATRRIDSWDHERIGVVFGYPASARDGFAPWWAQSQVASEYKKIIDSGKPLGEGQLFSEHRIEHSIKPDVVRRAGRIKAVLRVASDLTGFNLTEAYYFSKRSTIRKDMDYMGFKAEQRRAVLGRQKRFPLRISDTEMEYLRKQKAK